MSTALSRPVNIPVGWHVSQLRDHLVEPIRNGFSPVCPEHFTGEWVLSLASVGSDGYNPQGAKPAPVGDSRVTASRLAIGDLLVSRSNTPERVGLAGIYDGDPAPASYPDLLMRVRVGPTINQRLLLEQILSPKGRNYFAATARGSSGSMVKVDRAILEAFPIFAPHAEEEQRAIANALSDANALIDSLEQLLTKKRQIKQGAMQELLTGQRRLPGFAGPWVPMKLGDIATITMGRTPARLMGKYWGSGHKWLSIADLRGKVVSDSKEEITAEGAQGMEVVPAGTLLMSFKLTIGRLALAGCDLFTNEAICALRSPTVDKELLYYALSQVDFSLFGKQAVKGYTLNKESLRSVEVLLPTDPDEQQAIARVLSDMDTELTALESRLTKARALKQAMAQALLTGRIRLVPDGAV